MTRTTQAIFKKALKLPLETRADVVEQLLDSIIEDHTSVRKKIDKAWAREARSRLNAYLRDEIEASPLEEVMKTLRKRHVSGVAK